MTSEFAAQTTMPSAQMNNPFALWARLFSLLLLLVGIGIFLFITLRPVQVLPRITLAPGYALMDQHGEQVTSEDMRGRIVLYDMTYTHCGEGCVSTTPIMQAVQSRLGEIEAGDIPITLVTISVDAERDTPEALQAYAAKSNPDGGDWRFVTGDPKRLKWVVGGGFGVYYRADDPDAMKLDPAFMLVDGAGLLRAEYRTAVPDVDILLRDIRLVAEEANNSEGSARVAYEAAHLFLCYPR